MLVYVCIAPARRRVHFQVPRVSVVSRCKHGNNTFLSRISSVRTRCARVPASHRSLAYTFSAVVVVTNQVTTSFSSSRVQGGRGQGIASHTNSSSRAGASAFETEVSGGQGNSYIIPALGNTWHHCVSNRVSEGTGATADKRGYA